MNLKKKSFWYSKKLLNNKYILFLSYQNINNKEEFLNKYSAATDLIMTENYMLKKKNDNYKVHTFKNIIFKNQRYLSKNYFLQSFFVGVMKYIVFSNKHELTQYLEKHKILIKNTVLKFDCRYLYLNSFYLNNLHIDGHVIFKILFFWILYIIQIIYINYYIFLNLILHLNTNLFNKKRMDV